MTNPGPCDSGPDPSAWESRSHVLVKAIATRDRYLAWLQVITLVLLLAMGGVALSAAVSVQHLSTTLAERGRVIVTVNQLATHESCLADYQAEYDQDASRFLVAVTTEQTPGVLTAAAIAALKADIPKCPPVAVPKGTR